jgi:hypothetical protein
LRVRILKALTGIMEGHSLSQFLPGYIYDVTESFGLNLMALGTAIEVRSTDPAVSDDIDMSRLTGGVHVIPPDKAEDRPERRRIRRR